MHTQTMEGLIGARTNMNIMNVPMRVYKEARQKGDTAAMERAMGYAMDFGETAKEYQKKADEGMKKDAKEAKEQEKQAREKMLKERREEHKKLRETIEGSQEEKIKAKGNKDVTEKASEDSGQEEAAKVIAKDSVLHMSNNILEAGVGERIDVSL